MRYCYLSRIIDCHLCAPDYSSHNRTHITGVPATQRDTFSMKLGLGLSILIWFLPSIVDALTFETPSSSWEVGDSATVNWSTSESAGDPPSFALQIYELYYDELYTISNDTVTSLESLTITVPVVSQGGAWTLRATSQSDSTQAPYAQSGTFGIWAI